MSFKPDIEKTLGFALHHSSYLFKTAMKNVFASNGLNITPEEMILLFQIADRGSEQGDLVKKSLKDKTNIARLLSRMETKALIKKVEHEENGRQQIIHLRAKGKSLRAAAFPLIQKMAKDAMTGISAHDLDITQKTLNRLSLNLK